MAKSRRALPKSSAGMSKRDFVSARAFVSAAAGAANGKTSASEKVKATAQRRAKRICMIIPLFVSPLCQDVTGKQQWIRGR